MQIFIVMGEHFSVPGIIVEPFADMASASAKASELVGIMMEDAGCETFGDWERDIEALQETYGAAHCYVEILERSLAN